MAGHGGTQSAAQKAYVLYRKKQNNDWTKNVQYCFAAFVGLYCLLYVIEEVRITLSRHSKKRPSKLFQTPKNFCTRIGLMSFKFPFIGSRVYAPMLAMWLIFAGFLTAAIIARTPDVTRKHQYDLVTISKRSGNIGAAMLPMLFFLSMKNSPVGLFIGSSHERLNIVHRWTGRTVISVLAVHLISYTIYYKRVGKISQLTESGNIYGMIAFSMCLLIGLTSVAMVRRKAYEFFFVLHWAFTISMLVFAYLHIEDTNVWVKASAGIIGSDLILRLFRTWTFSSSFKFVSKAKLENINDELASVTIERSANNPLTSWIPGSHAFLHISAIGVHQRHPFTICSIPEDGFIRFIIKKQKGFTAALHKREMADVHCTVDGSYGSLAMTRFSKYPDVLLVAGGVGITFIYPILKSLLVRNNGVQTITFVWTTRHSATFEYFQRELRSIYESHEASRSNVVLSIRLVHTNTNGSGSPSSSEAGSIDIAASTPPLQVEEKKEPRFSEKHVNAGVSSMTLSNKRIVMQDLLEEVSADKDRLAVGVCGPSHLVLDSRRAVSDQLRGSKDIWLHSEEFEW